MASAFRSAEQISVVFLPTNVENRGASVKRIIFLAIIVLVLTARGSAAQGFISPFIGTTLTSPTETGSHTKAGWGVDLGALGKIVGAETEIAWYPEIIDIAENAIDKSKV